MANGLLNLDWLKKLSKPSKKRGDSRRRRLLGEQLESRQVLSGSSIEAPADEAVTAASLAEEDEVLAISAVHIRVGDKEYTVRSDNDVVAVDPGQHLQVVGIDYRLADGVELEGKVAFEGYLKKLKRRGSSYDYNDGRTGRSVQNGIIPKGTSHHPGLRGGWDMRQGYEKLQLALVRYNGDGPMVEDRVTIRLQVGTPDFEMSAARIRPRGGVTVAGNTTRIIGAWRNLGEGRYRNYAEVDVYHASDLSKIVWVGSFTRLTRGHRYARGEFLQRHDKFSTRWTPEEAGTYVLKFYADPEDRWVEKDETNNGIIMKLRVFENRREARAAGQRGRVWRWWTPESKIPGRFAGISSHALKHARSQLAAMRHDPPPASVPDSIFADPPKSWIEDGSKSDRSTA